MKTIIRLSIVVGFFLLLNGEPPRQVTAEVLPVEVNNTQVEKVIETTSPTPTPTPEPTPQPALVTTPLLTPKEQAKATLIDMGRGAEWYAVEHIGAKESSWNAFAVNSIGACGLFQALPCSKMNCELSDIPCQVRWATNYATQRYGNWHNAYNFWLKNKWW